ncbi:MAG TPA: hypothetical protein VGM64_04790 [Lacunisphaera sp.]
MVSAVSGLVNSSLRSLAVVVVLWCGAPASAQSEGVFVSAGESRPEPVFLRVISGQQVHLDLLLAAALPIENECRATLFAVAGPSVAKLSEQTGRLPVSPEGKTGSRIPLVIAIPSGTAGAKFVLRVECLTPTKRFLGTVQLRITEFDPIDELRHGLNAREIVVAGQSQRLRALFSHWQISFNDQPTDSATDAIVLIESGEKPTDDVLKLSSLLVEISFHSGSTLAVTGRPNGHGWKVEAKLPQSAKFSDIEAAGYFSEILQFISTLEKPPLPQ